jgi:hypothetical protein
MNGPQLYLVTCNCGEQLRVRLSQAGEQLTCKCGANVSVPTIRGLKQLPVVADEEHKLVTPVAIWQGPAFAVGVLALFVGCLVLAGTMLFPPPEINFDVTSVGYSDEELKRAATPVEELGIEQLYEEFHTLRTKGRNEQGRFIQSQIDQAYKIQKQRQLTGVGLTAIGALLAIIALVVPMLGKKSGS